MPRSICSLFLLVSFTSILCAEDWRVWRGPTLGNHAPASAAESIPVTWSKSENVLWRSPVPGKGHATPIVVDKNIFVVTHEEATKTISLLTYNLDDGKQLSRVVLHEDVTPPEYLHKKNTCASSTPACDGNAVYVVAQVNDAIECSAVTIGGKILWQRKVCPYRVSSKFWFGYGSSVLLLENSVVIPVDNASGERGLFALAKDDGRELWKADRPKRTSYATPILATIEDKPQILLSGCYQVASYDPASGEELWSVEATSQTACGTMVWKDSMVFASGSYPDPGTFGIRVSGDDAEVIWENKVKCYEQSMLIVGDYLYGISNKGIGYCWRAEDGKQMWKARIKGPHSASPLLIGERIYASNELGQTFVFRATPNGYKNLATNQLGDVSFASPIYADGKLILRHATMESGERKEFLYAVGNQ